MAQGRVASPIYNTTLLSLTCGAKCTNYAYKRCRYSINIVKFKCNYVHT